MKSKPNQRESNLYGVAFGILYDAIEMGPKKDEGQAEMQDPSESSSELPQAPAHPDEPG